MLVEHKRTQSTIDLLSQPSCSKHTETETLLPKEFDCDSSEEIEELNPKIKLPWQMRIKLKNTALTNDHFGLSDRATTAIASSVLTPIREKSVHRSELQLQNKDKHNQLLGLCFYGRKDNTLVIEQMNVTQFSKNQVLCTLVMFHPLLGLLKTLPIAFFLI
ncbi:hypothetical protein PR048_031906 [Dryococelus australis]|uniref:Uncharacterized protein n=1 Tax=Dryococelus australis TaxID=614101 RepID=A0ABQ9G7L1_9NEOP|nr:hypothetical protein PR048_031906 [Dryococelus australis]